MEVKWNHSHFSRSRGACGALQLLLGFQLGSISILLVARPQPSGDPSLLLSGTIGRVEGLQEDESTKALTLSSLGLWKDGKPPRSQVPWVGPTFLQFLLVLHGSMIQWQIY